MEELRALLKKTQVLPAAKTLSEDMLAEEIAQYRASDEPLSNSLGVLMTISKGIMNSLIVARP